MADRMMKKYSIIINESKVFSFDPIVGEDPEALILGTMPGKVSLKANEYYSHTRNLFWGLIGYTHDKHENIHNYTYNKKIEALKELKVSIWDVCHVVKRDSSLDKDISEEVPNDLMKFLEDHNSITDIGFNGKKAEKLYDRYFDRLPHIKYFLLPSTSPANAAVSIDLKKGKWNYFLYHAMKKSIFSKD